MSELKEGLYDQLVTRSIRRSLDDLASANRKSVLETLEENDCPDYLARHLVRQIKVALSGIPAEDRIRRQIELANSLLAFLKVRKIREKITSSTRPVRYCALSTAELSLQNSHQRLWQSAPC